MEDKFSDHEAREKFVLDINKNFSVIAPAGVGKTTAIVERIVKIAEHDLKYPNAAILPSLTVVTYTKKAAEEMLIRTKSALSERNIDVFENLEKAFFGTIHSLAFQIIKRQVHALNLSSSLQIVEDESALTLKFLRSVGTFRSVLPEDLENTFFRHFALDELIKLISQKRIALKNLELSKPPRIDLTDLLAFSPDKRNLKSVQEGKGLLLRWKNNYDNNSSFLELPSFERGGKDFKALWQSTFRPIKLWLSRAAAVATNRIQENFLDFRIKHGLIFYDDIVPLANRLLKKINLPVYRIILDEAQDTDKEQFNFLLSLASKSKNGQVEDDLKEIQQGYFSMVGDPQQSIYGSRANLKNYLEVHDKLNALQVTDNIVFDLTFRCSKNIVKAINESFPRVLDGKDEQVEYVKLNNHNSAEDGKVFSLKLLRSDSDDHVTLEAQLLASWIKDFPFKEKWGVENESEIAFLCPRNQWLQPLQKSFEDEGLNFQILSNNELWTDSPTYSFLAGLINFIAYPQDEFELLGVLREVFGISEKEIYKYIAYLRKQKLRLSQITCSSDINLKTEEFKVHGIVLALKELRNLVLKLPLSKGFDLLIEECNLVKRLLALADCDSSKEISDVLSYLRAMGIEFEINGNSWQKFARSVKSIRNKAKPVDYEPIRSAFQGLSCHKAKGLEWKVVVVPFLFRPIYSKPKRYPYISHDRASVVLNSFNEDKLAYNNQQTNELERLLYVALTRAKNALVLVDDGDLFKKSPYPSLAKLLKYEQSAFIDQEAIRV